MFSGSPSNLIRLLKTFPFEAWPYAHPYTYIQFHFPMNSFIILTAYYVKEDNRLLGRFILMFEAAFRSP